MTNGIHQPLNGVIGPGNLPYIGTPWASPGTLNMWSNINHHWSAPCDTPHWVDLSIGLAYSFTIANTTDNDIDSGTIELWGADASPTNWCEPGTFHEMDAIAGCTAIVTGVPEGPNVIITLGHDVIIRAHALCKFAAPCPKPFFQIRWADPSGGASGPPPTGVYAWATISSLKRTNFDHLTPWGFIPQPIELGIESVMAQLPPGQQAAQLPPGQQAAQQRAPQPAQARAPQPAQPQARAPQPQQPPPPPQPQRRPNPRPPAE